MARIGLILTKTPWDDRRQFHRQGPALVEAGHEVVYVASRPDRDVDHPFEYVEVDEDELRGSRRTGALNLSSKIRDLDLDLVQLCSLELLPLGLNLKRTSSARVIYDCREDIASALYERRKSLPVVGRKLLFQAVRALEGWAARSFDGIVTADPGVYELHSGMPDERKHILYNTALLSQFPASFPALPAREFDLVLLGSMSSLRSGPDVVLDAMGELARRGKRTNALFIGEPEGEIRSAMKEGIERNGLGDLVEVTGRVPHAEVAAHLNRGRIGIVPLRDYPKFHKNIACKAFEYMACGMPTIASDLPPQHIFLHPEIARFFPCGDVAALADQIEELVGAPEECERMGLKARAEVEERWNGEAAQKHYCEFIGRLLEMPLRG